MRPTRRRGAGWSAPIPTSSTSTKSTRAATSQRGSSRSSSPRRSEPHSNRCAKEVAMSTVTGTDIQTFKVDIPEDKIDDLRRRIEATRWPTKELVDDASQGIQLATLKALADYWATEYDFDRLAERLNALPQYTTEIDGLDIHFIHVESQHEDALPLIITHGWPGSVIEMLEVIEPLTAPTAPGG